MVTVFGRNSELARNKATARQIARTNAKCHLMLAHFEINNTTTSLK